METSPKFNQVAASESAFKRNRVWSTLAPSCCIPSHPHDLDQLTVICDSVLPQFPAFQFDLRLSWAQEHDHLTPKQSFILVPDRVHYPVCYQSSYCWPSALVPVDESWSKNPSPVSRAKCVPRLPSAFLHIWASLPQVPAAVLRLPTGTSHYFVLDTICCCWFWGMVIRDYCIPCWTDCIFMLVYGPVLRSETAILSLRRVTSISHLFLPSSFCCL